MLEKLLQKSLTYVKRNSASILTWIGAAGVVITSVVTVKTTIKAVRFVDKIEVEMERKLNKWEVLKVAGGMYIPAVLLGAATISCMFGSSAIRKKQEARMVSAYLVVKAAYEDYKNKVKDVCGDDVDSKIRADILHDLYSETSYPKGEEFFEEDQLFYEENYGQIFRCLKERVLYAEYELNKQFAQTGSVCLKDFYTLLGLETSPMHEALGWYLDIGETREGHSWIDFRHDVTTLDDGLECCMISIENPPIYNYLDFN